MTLYIPPSFIRLMAALSSYKEIKERCRGRFDYIHGGNYCKCEKEEICQVVLAEALGRADSAIVDKKHRPAFEELVRAGVVRVRRVKNPPGKPQVFYSLPEDWEKKLIEAVKREIEEQKETLMIANVGSPFKEEEA